MAYDPSKPLTLRFKTLPLVEATIRVAFGQMIPLTFKRVVTLQKTLSQKFTEITEPKQYEIPPGAREALVEIGPAQMPGATLSGTLTGIEVTIQRDAIVTTWRRRPGLDQPEYPQYAALREAHWEVFGSYSDICETAPIPVTAVNMSYVNFVQIAGGDIWKYLQSPARVEVAARSKQVHKLEVSWHESEPSDVDLRFAIDRGEVVTDDERREGYRLTTVAGIRMGETSDPKLAVDTVHARLQYFFEELISNYAKAEWGFSRE